MISRALDDNKSVLVSSLELSSAFDVFNIDLLLKRLKTIGLLEVVITLIPVWLKKRMNIY